MDGTASAITSLRPSTFWLCFLPLFLQFLFKVMRFPTELSSSLRVMKFMKGTKLSRYVLNGKWDWFRPPPSLDQHSADIQDPGSSFSSLIDDFLDWPYSKGNDLVLSIISLISFYQYISPLSHLFSINIMSRLWDALSH